VQKNNAVPHAHAFCSLFFGFVATQIEQKEGKKGVQSLE
jgi:hypothetical protein